MADWLRRSSALWQTGYRGGRLLCGRLVEEVVCSVADWLRRRSSALWQTGQGGGRLLWQTGYRGRLQHDGRRLVIVEVVCSVAD